MRSAPFLRWPARPGRDREGTSCRTWLPLRSRFFMLAVSFGIWAWFMPSLERTQRFELGWIFEVWLRNLILVTIVAGGLHVWFYVVRPPGRLPALRRSAFRPEQAGVPVREPSPGERFPHARTGRADLDRVRSPCCCGPMPTGTRRTISLLVTTRSGSWCSWRSSRGGRFCISRPTTGCCTPARRTAASTRGTTAT